MCVVSENNKNIRELFYSYNKGKLQDFLSSKENLLLFENFLRFLDDNISDIYSLNQIDNKIQSLEIKLEKQYSDNTNPFLPNFIKEMQKKRNTQVNLA